MAEVSEIYSEFNEIGPNDSMGIIRLYEKNQILLDNKSIFYDKDDFTNYALLVGQYVISLETIGKYSKAIKYADRLLQLIDSKSEEFEINQQDFTTYWSILTTKGRSFYHLKDYRNSIPIFERLVAWDADNDYLKDWLDSSRSRKRNAINKYLYSISVILYFTEVFFGDKIGNQKIKLFLIVSALILFIIALVNEHLVDRIFKMIKKV